MWLSKTSPIWNGCVQVIVDTTTANNKQDSPQIPANPGHTPHIHQSQPTASLKKGQVTSLGCGSWCQTVHDFPNEQSIGPFWPWIVPKRPVGGPLCNRGTHCLSPLGPCQCQSCCLVRQLNFRCLLQLFLQLSLFYILSSQVSCVEFFSLIPRSLYRSKTP